MLKWIYLLPLLFLCFNFQSYAQQEKLNLKGDLRVHDPVMIKQGDTYYIFSTGKGVNIKSSPDMINWKNIGRVFAEDDLPAWHRDDIPDQDGHLWAPDIHYADGMYHLYYSVSAWMNFNSSIGYATNTTLDSSDPEYQWVDQGKVISYKDGGEGVNVIDPNIYIEEDGSKWMLYGSYTAGLRMVELDIETGMLKEENPDLVTLTTSLGEGVYLIKGPNYYYILASRGICCKGKESTYQIVMGRSKNLEGPYLNREGKSWVENNYTLLLAGDEDEPGRGHNGIFAEEDTTYLVYHAYTMSEDGASMLNIAPLYLDAEDWLSLDPKDKLFHISNHQKRMFIKE